MDRWQLSAIALLVLAAVVWVAGGLDSSSSDPGPVDVRDRCREFAPLVEAIDRYRAEVGLWPERLEDLEVEAPLARLAGDCRYRRVRGSWILTTSCLAGGLWYHGDENRWELHPSPIERVAVPVEPPSRLSHPPVTASESVLAELRRRIERSGEADHHLSLITVLHQADRGEEALAACKEFQQAHPDSLAAWGTKAQLLAELGHVRQAARLLRSWASCGPFRDRRFVRMRFLWRHGRASDAIPDVERELRRPAQGCAGWSFDDVSFVLASLALDAQRYELTLEVCERWSRHEDHSGARLAAFRAAALHAMGRGEEALSQAELALSHGSERDDDPRHRLHQAILAGNRAYRFDPGPHPGLEFDWPIVQ